MREKTIINDKNVQSNKKCMVASPQTHATTGMVLSQCQHGKGVSIKINDGLDLLRQHTTYIITTIRTVTL